MYLADLSFLARRDALIPKESLHDVSVDFFAFL
jgi:hypothetical protein